MNSDEMVKKGIMDYANWDGRIDAAKISVNVDRGNVLLEGSINTYSSYRRLMNYASNVPNVVSVETHMDVKYGIPQPEDAQIVSYVENSIRWDADIQGSDIKVSSKDGHVTLSGNVDSFWKKELAEERAASILGVKEITNELAIVHSNTVTDDVISENIVNAMKANRYVDVANINVNIEDGNVNLTGTAHSDLERDEAYRIALYTGGVHLINNAIKIDN